MGVWLAINLAWDGPTKAKETQGVQAAEEPIAEHRRAAPVPTEAQAATEPPPPPADNPAANSHPFRPRKPVKRPLPI